MTAPYATPNDVADRLGRPLTDAEGDWAPTLLADAQISIETRTGPLAAWIAAGKTSIQAVIKVEAAAVARVLRNPDGYRSEQDGDYGYQIDTRVAAGFLMLTDSDWLDIGYRGGAFTITPVTAANDPTRDTNGAWSGVCRDLDWS